VLAVCRLMPREPARVEMRKTRTWGEKGEGGVVHVWVGVWKGCYWLWGRRQR
jgi:hypothetical protein